MSRRMPDLSNPFTPTNGETDLLKHIFQSKKFRKHLASRAICLIVIFFIWVYINGGILPHFLRQKIPMLQMGSDSSVLVYFNNMNDDGANIHWAHAVNTIDKLERALYSHDVHMIEADVMLRGQGTQSQELVPIMAQLPDTDSDVMFDDWLAEVMKAGSKGIKLDFQAIDALEITLQKLKENKHKLAVPIWLHANVLQGPWGRQATVDATRFVRIIKKMFPECTVSLGWTTGHHTDLSQSGYTWDMVLDMYHLIHKLELEPPLVIETRLSLVPNSVPQLKWLTDNVRASLLTWQEPTDLDDGFQESLMYLSYRYPPHNVFFDLTDNKLGTYLTQNHLNPSEKVDARVTMRDNVMFRPQAWVKMGFYMEAHSILPSTEATVLTSRAVYMVTKSKYKYTSDVKLQGRVQFLNRKSMEPEEGRTGLSIFIRPTAYSNFEKIVGIKCFIGVDGQLVVENSGIKGLELHESQRMTPGSASCYRFGLVDTGNEIVFSVSVQHDCSTLDSARPNDRTPLIMRVPVSPNIGGGANTEHPFIVKLEDSKRTAVIDELTVKYKE